MEIHTRKKVWVTNRLELLFLHGQLRVELVVDVVNAARMTLHVEVALLQRRDALLLILALRHRLITQTHNDQHAAVRFSMQQ